MSYVFSIFGIHPYAMSYPKVQDNGREAFVMFVAIHREENGDEIAIGAPTVEQLERFWNYRYAPLDIERVQHVHVRVIKEPKK